MLFQYVIGTQAILKYKKEVVEKSDDEKSKIIESATKYNDSLKDVLVDSNDVSTANYLEEINKDDVIGYISIPKIDVYLAIYHGTNSSVLQVGIGHLEGTSLPVGGKGTHSVLTGHSGLVKQRLFDDIHKLEVGDKFYIYVMDKKLTYMVDQIKVVEPDDDRELAIDENKDYITLITCTPYGINTHRLLVRGIRVLDEEQPLDSNLDTNIEQVNNSNVNDNDNDIEFFESRNAKYNKVILIIKITVIVVFLLLVLGLVSSILPKKKARISKKTNYKNIY